MASISLNQRVSANDEPSIRAIFDAHALLVEVGVGLVVGTWVDVSWMDNKVHFRPSYMQLDEPDHLLHGLTLHRIGGRQCIYVFIGA